MTHGWLAQTSCTTYLTEVGFIGTGDVRPLYSCVVDARPDFRLQCYYWALSLMRLGGIDPSDLYVHSIGALPSQLRFWLESHGVHVVVAEPYDADYPYLNKLVQIDTFKASNRPVVLMDCDTVAARPIPWRAPLYTAAAMVNCALPPESVVRTLWAKAGFELELGESEFLPGPEGRATPIGNRNGGVYLFAPAVIERVGAEWQRWARFCLANTEDFGTFGVHADQVAFALALSSLGIDADVLPGSFNFPTHLALSEDQDVSPYVLHYHRELDDAQLLKMTGLLTSMKPLPGSTR